MPTGSGLAAAAELGHGRALLPPGPPSTMFRRASRAIPVVDPGSWTFPARDDGLDAGAERRDRPEIDVVGARGRPEFLLRRHQPPITPGRPVTRITCTYVASGHRPRFEGDSKIVNKRRIFSSTFKVAYAQSRRGAYIFDLLRPSPPSSPHPGLSHDALDARIPGARDHAMPLGLFLNRGRRARRGHGVSSNLAPRGPGAPTPSRATRPPSGAASLWDGAARPSA